MRTHQIQQSVRHKKNLATICLVMFFICGLSLSRIQEIEAKPLNMVMAAVEPYGIVTEDRQMTGIGYEMLKRIAEEAGLEYNINIVPFARVVSYLETGQADVTIVPPHEALDQVTIRIAPTFPQRIIVLGLAGTRYATLKDLHGKVVATLRAGSYDETFAADMAIAKYPVNNYEQGLKMLCNKRLDAIIGMEDGMLYVAKKLEYSRDMFGEPLVLKTQQAYLYISKQTADESMIQNLKAVTDRLRDQGVFEEIRASYTEDF